MLLGLQLHFVSINSMKIMVQKKYKNVLSEDAGFDSNQYYD